MAKLLSSNAVIAVLLANGFRFVSQRGSHRKYRDALGHTDIVPAERKQIPRGTLGSIIRQCHLPNERFD